MKKQLFAAFLALCMLLTLTACGKPADDGDAAVDNDAVEEVQYYTTAEKPIEELVNTVDGSTNMKVALDYDSMSPEAQASWDELKAAGKIVMGTSADYAPFEFHKDINGKDTIVGFDLYIAQVIANSLGVDLEVVDMSFDNILMSLDQGDFDMGYSFIVTEERLLSADFTDPYYNGVMVLVIRAEDADKYTSLDDFKGLPVAGQLGAIQETLAKEVSGESTAILLKSVVNEILELKSGKVEAVVLDNTTAVGYVAVHDDLVICEYELPYESSGTCVAVQKGDVGMQELLNAILNGMTEEEVMMLMGSAQVLSGFTGELE